VIEKVALVAAVVLPLWNIPLIIRIIKRRSSDDISLAWAFGVWICMLFMAPQGFTSADIVWRVFNITNVILFTCVMAVVVFYRIKKAKELSIKEEGQ